MKPGAAFALARLPRAGMERPLGAEKKAGAKDCKASLGYPVETRLCKTLIFQDLNLRLKMWSPTNSFKEALFHG